MEAGLQVVTLGRFHLPLPPPLKVSATPPPPFFKSLKSLGIPKYLLTGCGKKVPWCVKKLFTNNTYYICVWYETKTTTTKKEKPLGYNFPVVCKIPLLDSVIDTYLGLDNNNKKTGPGVCT